MQDLDVRKNEILKRVYSLFTAYGIRSVSMDDVAAELGMSKKTLYKIFKDKRDMVSQVVMSSCMNKRAVMDKHRFSGDNAIEEMLLINRHLIDVLKDNYPSMIYDLRKYFPEVYAQFMKVKRDILKQTAKKNLERGIGEGLYRQDLNKDILTGITAVMMEYMINMEDTDSSGNESGHILTEVFNYHIRGLASEQGLNFLKSRTSE